jgi:hypothetical protein
MKKERYLKSSIEDCKKNLEEKRNKRYDNTRIKQIAVETAEFLLKKKIKEEKNLTWREATQYCRNSL